MLLMFDISLLAYKRVEVQPRIGFLNLILKKIQKMISGLIRKRANLVGSELGIVHHIFENFWHTQWGSST